MSVFFLYLSGVKRIIKFVLRDEKELFKTEFIKKTDFIGSLKKFTDETHVRPSHMCKLIQHIN